MATIYGEGWIDAARDKIKAHLDAAVTATAATDAPINYVYDSHVVADMRFNAITLDLERVDTPAGDDQGRFNTSAGPLIVKLLHFSIRSHTAHVDDTRDTVLAARLLNSTENYLWPNRDLGDGYQIEEITDHQTRLIHEDTKTYGGQFDLQILCAIQF